MVSDNRRVSYATFFNMEIIVIIIFVVVDFTGIIIDFHLLVAVEVINVTFVVIASLVVNGMIVGTGIIISICSTTFFLFRCYQKLLLLLFQQQLQEFLMLL